MKITVKIYESGTLLGEKVFDEGVYRAGRSEFADINLPSDSISRSHFEIRVTGNNVYLTNMSSSGRIRLNGKQIETSEVADGDEIQAGPYAILISYGENIEANGIAEAVPAQGEGQGEGQGEAAANEYQMNELPPEPKLESSRVSGVDLGGDAGVPENPGSSPFARALSRDVEGTAALNRAETVVEAKPVVAKLVFTEGPRKGEELFIEAYEISLGRSKKADIFLDDDKLSRIHAKIARVGMGFRLVDQQSRNGTYVNGMRILEHPLSSFDTIEIGSTKIRFLIHDMVAGDLNRMARTSLMDLPPEKRRLEQTKSLQVGEGERELFLDAQLGPPPTLPPEPPLFEPPGVEPKRKPNTRIVILAVALIGLVGLFLFVPSTPDKVAPPVTPAATTTKQTKPAPISSVVSKEFGELSPEEQRAVEGHYNTALRAADREMYEEALANLQKIHDVLPYYKESMTLKEQYEKRLKERQAQIAAERAKKDDKQELQILINDGIQYLKEGDFSNAEEAFNSAIQLDPENKIVKKGLKAADMHIRDLEMVPPDRDPIAEKKKLVGDLFEKAVKALNEARYQEAIQFAEDIRKIELPGETGYLNEAKQIIDQSRQKQKEQFEPFLIDAKGKYAEGDFSSSRDLCEEMLKKDPSFTEAKECMLKAKNQLNKLAKEAYTLGYVLESMNRIEEAKQYWNRAKNYVKPGDPYYDKVMKKLDDYQ